MFLRSMLCLGLSLTLVPAGAAPAPDRIDAALITLRDRVVFYDEVKHGPLVRYGGQAIALAMFATGVLWLGRYPRRGPLEPIERWVVSVPLTVAAGGAVAIVAGFAKRRRAARPTRHPRSAAEYRTVAGFEDFMRLTPREQSIVAHADPELGQFVISLADAYVFLSLHPVDKVGRPPVRGRRG